MLRKTVRLRHSIAAQLLKVVFGLYFLVAVLVTVVQLTAEYYHIQDSVKQELKKVATTFGPGIANALWNMNRDSLESILFGMQQNQIVTRITIVDVQDNEIRSTGLPRSDEGENIAVSPKTAELQVPEESLFSDEFGYEFTIVHDDGSGEGYEVGNGIIYSDRSIVLSRVQYGFFLIVINSLIKTAALWVIFLIFGRIILGRPIENLTSGIERVNIADLGKLEGEDLKIHVKTSGDNELKVLEEAFNGMIEKLGATIIAREKAESEVRASEARLRQVIDLVPHIIFAKDRNGKFLLVNRATAELFNTTIQDMVGRNFLSFHPVVEIESLMKNDREVIEQRTSTWVGEEEYTDVRGVHHIFQTHKTPFNFEGVRTALGVGVDITERIQKEEEILKLNEELENRVIERTKDLQRETKAAQVANRTKSEFLANMSHEIRTPMNAVLGFAEILLNKVADTQHLRYLESIYSSGHSLLALIDDILDLSKVEAGKLALEYRPASPQRLFHEIEVVFEQKVKEKGLQLLVDIPPDLPSGLFLDETRLRQILINLIGNAVKFTHNGFIKLSLSYTMNESGKKVDLTLMVEDTGIGIPEDQQKSIFSPFSQVTGQKYAEYGGTGLGLAISRRLVEMMGGTILLTSKVDEGSRFSIVLKDVEIVESAALSIEEEFLNEKMDSIRFEGQTILVADTLENNRALILGYLEDQELNFIEAGNGIEALEMAEKVRPDLLLLDVNLAEMDGFEVSKALNATASLQITPVIFVTASVMKEDELKLEHHGAVFLKKPLSRNNLLSTLCRFLSHQVTEIKKVVVVQGTEISDHSNLPGIVQELETIFLPQWRDLQEKQPLRDTKQLGEEIRNLGIDHGVKELEHWGETLIISVEHFDVIKIRSTLNDFPGLVESLRSSSQSHV